YAQRPLLFRNQGNGTFAEVSRQAGGPLQEPIVGRGVACGDYDNDGNLDLLVTSNNGPARLLRNDGGNRGNWLELELRGAPGHPTGTTASSRDALGALVKVSAGGRLLRDTLRSGSSYLSQGMLRLHFGLGQSTQADAVEICWPSGAVTRLAAVK